MAVALQVVAGIGFAMLLVTVHEYGHLLVARAAGVPAADVRVDLDRRPPAVLLQHDGRWLGPDDDGYEDAFTRHRPSGTAAWAFVMGGLLVETAVTAGAVGLLLAIDLAPVARVLASASAVLFAAYLVGDVLASARAGRPYGDHSAAWRIARAATTAAVAVAAAVKAAGMLLAL